MFVYFHNQADKLKKSTRVIPITLITLLVLGRLSFGEFDFSHFIVAGTDFVDPSSVPSEIIVIDGQGYDGQFFYRLANNPLDTSKTSFGVTLDHIEYRMQRIVYPILVWTLSAGGYPGLIPFMLVLCNALGFIGIFFISQKICIKHRIHLRLYLLPIFLFGAFMALARDASEIIEVFLFVLAVYLLFERKKLALFIGVSILMVFTRETSVLALLPILFLYGIHQLKTNGLNRNSILRMIAITIPPLVLALWRYSLHKVIASEDLTSTHQNLALPFSGLLYGATQNTNVDTLKNVLESIFWYALLTWNIWLTFIVFKQINYRKLLTYKIDSALGISYVSWGVLAIFLGPGIYVDDWAYVRVFSLWNMIGFLLLMLNNKPVSRPFILYSTLLLAPLLVRLIVRV
ncbi:MAG: hypothetical protein CL840_17225 [Crocinitomicaceae bacterium]|nr:hypothetical protein [Crocinitomicaceae bacterium]